MAVEQSGTEASAGRPVEKTAEVAGAGEDEATPKAAAADSDLDEMKRKFREALARKHSAHASAEGADNTGKVHGTHGPASSRRSFRRKSG